MLIRTLCLAAGLLMPILPTQAGTTNPNTLNANREVRLSFNQYQPNQRYEKDILKTDWHDQVVWDWTMKRAQITQDSQNPKEKFLRVSYPANVVGPWHSGAQFLTRLPSSNDYWVSYKVRFKEGFDFKQGGKLPGLASGDGKYAGGVKPTAGDGWTARLMWRKDGSLVPYLYYVGMPESAKFGDYWDMDAKIIPGKWHTISQRIHLNTGGQRNGQYEVWFDGKQVTYRNNMLWRYGTKGQIDAFLFSTFHGGAGLDWAPRWNSFADFDEIVVSHNTPASVANTYANR